MVKVIQSNLHSQCFHFIFIGNKLETIQKKFLFWIHFYNLYTPWRFCRFNKVGVYILDITVNLSEVGEMCDQYFRRTCLVWSTVKYLWVKSLVMSVHTSSECLVVLPNRLVQFQPFSDPSNHCENQTEPVHEFVG